MTYSLILAAYSALWGHLTKLIKFVFIAATSTNASFTLLCLVKRNTFSFLYMAVPIPWRNGLTFIIALILESSSNVVISVMGTIQISILGVALMTTNIILEDLR